MLVNPAYPRHIRTKECQLGVARKVQRKLAVSSALALRRQITIHGDVLERVEVFKYLGRLLAQDDNNVQAIQNNCGKHGANELVLAKFSVERMLAPG